MDSGLFGEARTSAVLVQQRETRRRQIDRLYDQEREERAERRGLEQRTSALLAATFVLFGLGANAVSNVGQPLDAAATVFLLIATGVGGFAVFFCILTLVGVHDTDSISVRDAIGWGRPLEPTPPRPEPEDLTAADLDEVATRIGRLRLANSRSVRVLRAAALFVGLALGSFSVALTGSIW